MNNNRESEDDGIITLLSADGEEIEFREVAGIAYKGEMYAILQPKELLIDMEEDEALVFHVVFDKDGDVSNYEIVLDDEIIEAVFEEYRKLLESMDD